MSGWWQSKLNGDDVEQSIRFPVVVGSVLRPFAVLINNDGTNAESIDKDAAAADDDGGGGGSKNGCWSDGIDSFNGEFAADEDEDEEEVFDSRGSEDGIGFDKSLGKELHGDKEDFWS